MKREVRKNVVQLCDRTDIIHDQVNEDAQIIFGTKSAAEEDDMNDEMVITLIAAGFDEEDDGEVMISSDPVFVPKQIKTPAPADNPPEKKKIVVDDDEFSVPPFLRTPRR